MQIILVIIVTFKNFLLNILRQVAYIGLKLLGSSNPPASVPQVAGTTGVHHCRRLYLPFVM
jgi:hypothetical protein